MTFYATEFRLTHKHACGLALKVRLVLHPTIIHRDCHLISDLQDPFTACYSCIIVIICRFDTASRPIPSSPFFQPFRVKLVIIMTDNVGLSTPRGSGTSGYVQRNLAHIKPRDMGAPYPKDLDSLRHRQRQPDKGILEHDRKREVEVKVFELRDKLEEEEYGLPLPCYGTLTDRSS